MRTVDARDLLIAQLRAELMRRRHPGALSVHRLQLTGTPVQIRLQGEPAANGAGAAHDPAWGGPESHRRAASAAPAALQSLAGTQPAGGRLWQRPAGASDADERKR